MPVHEYTYNDFAKYFYNIHEALCIVFPKHPLILSLGRILAGKFSFLYIFFKDICYGN